MKIESARPFDKVLEKASETPSWDKFFSHFENISKEDKAAYIEHLMQHLSHQIHHNMQRMIRVYKEMRKG
ncbi:MAG: hypothetical protein S4CHLAM37_12730 [Chlamydiia bacterium]|nr:hypothetical protein [Chlamydiia bacterium]